MTAQYAIMAHTRATSVCLALAGELDLAALADLEATFARIAAGQARHEVQVDLANATFIDSSIVGALVTARQDAVARGTTLTVTNARGMVERVLVVTGVYPALRNSEL